MARRWLVYLKERFPLVVYLIVAGGITFSGLWLYGSRPSVLPIVLTLYGLLIFFFELRLMDELKDYQKDLTAHPQRPLPRGLLSIEEVKRAIFGVAVSMGVFALLLAALGFFPAAVTYLAITLYLLGMFFEFFIGRWLNDRPLTYALSHQFILVLLCVFSVVMSAPEKMFALRTLGYGLLVVGGFFAYEVCRKLSPQAHPILKTYLSVYGPGRSFLIVLGCVAVATFGALLLGLEGYLLPIHLGLLASWFVIFRSPNRYKWVEAVATLSLLIHLWLPYFYQLTTPLVEGGTIR